MRHDVAQVTVGFNKHRVVDPTAVEDDTRRLLKRRAFDHLLTLALVRFADIQGERADLEQERGLMRGKLAALRAVGGWDSATMGAERRTKRPPTRGRCNSASGRSMLNLAPSAPACSNPISTSWWTCWPGGGEPARRARHAMRRSPGVKQAQASEMAPEITLATLHNSVGRSVCAPDPDRAGGPAAAAGFPREAQRFLG